MKHSPGFLKLVDDAKSRVREVSIEETRKKLEAGKVKVLDVREDSEWAKDHVPGAVHLGKGIIERDIEQTGPDRAAAIAPPATVLMRGAPQAPLPHHPHPPSGSALRHPLPRCGRGSCRLTGTGRAVRGVA